MVDIDYILELMDWNNSKEDQQKGIQLARNVKCISVFFQPGVPYGKRVWENCAKVLAEKCDDELMRYLTVLFEWLADMNWPGAYCIFERLQKYSATRTFDIALRISMEKSRLLKDEVWESTLNELREVRELTQ